MTARYYVTLTEYGATLVAQAHDVAEIELTHLVVGDANGIPYDPIDQKSRTTLIHQTASVPVQSVQINGSVTTVTATIAATIGGFNLHEIGLTDSTGQLVYIGNYHGGYKPVIAEGAGGDLSMVINIDVESGKDALITIDATVVIANKDWVLNRLEELTESFNLLLDEKTQSILLGDLVVNSDDFSPSRVLGTAYVNDSPRPRIITVLSNLSTGNTQLDGYFAIVPGAYKKIAAARINSNVSDGGCNITFIVPPNAYYKVEGTGITNWFETW